MSTLNPYLDPTKAKLAAKILKQQRAELSSAIEKNAELAKELEQLKRQQECVKIAYQLSEIGRIPKDFASILEKAGSLAESDTKLEVIKEAIDMAQNNFDLGSLDNTKLVSGRTDQLTEVLMSLGS
jgi:23S rRNA-/tRNA-specific pseudouridylate synthase